MRVNGEWLLCDDGIIRPTIPASIQVSDGSWKEAPFLLDAGADRTVISARFLNLLQSLESIATGPSHLVGVGGEVGSITAETAISFRTDDERLIAVRGQFAVFTEIESADLSVLGRDVTNNFTVIYDYHNRLVALLADPHYYEIKT